jgi:hypothetical protein
MKSLNGFLITTVCFCATTVYADPITIYYSTSDYELYDTTSGQPVETVYGIPDGVLTFQGPVTPTVVCELVYGLSSPCWIPDDITFAYFDTSYAGSAAGVQYLAIDGVTKEIDQQYDDGYMLSRSILRFSVNGQDLVIGYTPAATYGDDYDYAFLSGNPSASVPEPGTMLIALMELCGIVFVRRKTFLIESTACRSRPSGRARSAMTRFWIGARQHKKNAVTVTQDDV